ncbi:26S proteasome non-ATPase regulatory subunit A [Spatholobus suberectus]|nr:26S proteasome non-ATPase regulatory subunit A [Spatholobus suberectus]
MAANEDDREMLQDIINNSKLSEGHLTLARDIEVEPKSPEDIYKAHLLDGHTSAGASVDSARQNLAATFVNAFVNAGFDQGMILLWDVDSGLAQLDKYFHGNDNHVIAGALLGVGIVNCSIKNDCYPLSSIYSSLCSAMALLGYYTGTEDASISIGAIMGLGIAYAGSQNLIEMGNLVLQSSHHESVEATAEVSKTFNEKIRKYCDLTLLSCAYAGTGDALKVKNLFDYCSQHLEKGEKHEGFAVLGIAMVAMAEELGLEMAIRSQLEHLLHSGEQNIRRAVPLALGLLCISNPKVKVMDTLSRLSHNTDSEVATVLERTMLELLACSAIFQASTTKIPGFCFVYASSSCPYFLILGVLMGTDFRFYRTALAGLITMLHACLNMKAIELGKYHYVLYFLVLAMQPRMLLTVDEKLKPLSVPVRVGHAVDLVGQAGCPKTITGFQTHSIPALLAAGDRAELATEK